MNTRTVIALAVIVAAIVGGALWFLNSSPSPQAPAIVSATPGPIVPKSKSTPEPERPAAPAPKPLVADQKMPVEDAAAKAASDAADDRINKIIEANPDNTDAANTATAQQLLNLLPTIPVENQVDAAQHITNLLPDTEFKRVLPILKNPAMAEEVIDVFFTDLMNRDDSIKLPTLLDVAKIPNHPSREEAITDLQIFLDEDFGNDWPKWEAAMKEYLKKQAAENAETPDPNPVVTPIKK